MTRLRRLVPALAAGLLALAVPPALAADGSSYAGDCQFDSITQETLTGSEYHGEVSAEVVLYSNTHGNVVNATVTCDLRVNGVSQVAVSGWGSGAVVFASPLTFTAGEWDVVDFCTIVDYTSDSTPTVVDCYDTTNYQVPPQELLDLFGYLFDVTTAAEVYYADPVACEAFKALAPGTEPVTILPEGDVFVNGEKFWDCPPYDNPVPPPPPPPPSVPFPVPPSGGGYDTGDAGFLALVDRFGDEVATTCGFLSDGSSIEVVGTTATRAADTARVRCRLEDTATGAVLYDETVTANGASASLRGSVAANGGPVTVCTEGAGTWGSREVVVGLHCRPGEPVV